MRFDNEAGKGDQFGSREMAAAMVTLTITSRLGARAPRTCRGPRLSERAPTSPRRLDRRGAGPEAGPTVECPAPPGNASKAGSPDSRCRHTAGDRRSKQAGAATNHMPPNSFSHATTVLTPVSGSVSCRNVWSRPVSCQCCDRHRVAPLMIDDSVWLFSHSIGLERPLRRRDRDASQVGHIPVRSAWQTSRESQRITRAV